MGNKQPITFFKIFASLKLYSGFDIVDNTASILTRRRRYSRTNQDIYYLTVLISDGGVPPLSSSSTLTIRVCACERDGRVRTCHAEAFLSSAGLSTGALIAILLCVIILLGKPFSVLSSAIPSTGALNVTGQKFLV